MWRHNYLGQNNCDSRYRPEITSLSGNCRTGRSAFPHEDFHDYTDKENISDILFIACFGCIVYLVDLSGQ